MKKSTLLLEHRGVIAYVEQRRRYGTKTFTWVGYKDSEGNYFDFYGDPFPSVLPKAIDLVKEIEERVLRAPKFTYDEHGQRVDL